MCFKVSSFVQSLATTFLPFQILFAVNLQIGESYFFRVAAFNEEGLSDYTEMPASVEIIDKFEPPEILDEIRNLTIKAGKPIR